MLPTPLLYAGAGIAGAYFLTKDETPTAPPPPTSGNKTSSDFFNAGGPQTVNGGMSQIIDTVEGVVDAAGKVAGVVNEFAKFFNAD